MREKRAIEQLISQKNNQFKKCQDRITNILIEEGSTRTTFKPESCSPFETKPLPPPISKKILLGPKLLPAVLITLFLCLTQKL